VERLNADADMDVGESTVYPILARLHREKFPVQRRVASPNGPPRRYFQLTQAGLHYYEHMIGEWESLNLCVYRLTQKGITP
jgi:PadR family transcriptional regulator PadR